MKNLMFLLILSGAFLVSCNKKEDLKLFCIDVTKVCEAIPFDDMAINKVVVEEMINKLTSDLTPVPTNADPLGQKAHLNTLIDRLNNCDCMDASLECYGCMQSFPVQSGIKIVVKKSDGDVERNIRLRTSETETLKFSGID